MAPHSCLDVDTLGHVFCLGHIRNDGVDLTRGTLAELKEERGFVREFDLIQHVAEQYPGNPCAGRRVADALRRVKIVNPVDSDIRGA